MANAPGARLDAGFQDLRVLRALNSNYVNSAETSDVRWYAENLTEDFVNSNPDGSLGDRAGFLAQIAPPCRVANLPAEDVRIRILGEFAVIHGRTAYRRSDGRAGAGRYTDVRARRGGRWFRVSADSTRG